MPLSQQQILDALSPYRHGFPPVPHLPPGTVVSTHNWQGTEEVLPPELCARVREGDLTIPVVPMRGVLLVTWPVDDGELPELEVLQSLSAWLADLLRHTDKKVLVHCVASVNRSSLLIGCTLQRFLGLSGEAVIRYLEEKSGGYAVLTNHHFREYVKALR